MNRTWRPFQAETDTLTTSRAHTNSAEVRTAEPNPRVKSSRAQNKDAPTESVDRVRSNTLTFRNMHEHGELLTRYLEARKAIFLDRFGWCVSETDGMEFDQYDTPFAHWVILHQFGEILGGVRMLPTTAKCGIYSYMLRDAQLGMLEDLPTDILFFPAPVEHNVWEATRFFITDAVPAVQRRQIQSLLFRSMSRAAAENGGSYILGVVPAIWSRWARRIGVSATPIGAPFSIDGTASQSVLFEARDFCFEHDPVDS
ncbi:acyl-homoserine-lactone synthase [Roseovarius sp. 2305UL8-3]|uniref:acyl-homoserine-lactone synthase n=1 Tax=Roseovarius conchicola TaxID=3121636 RepID=UPI003528EED2